MAYTYNFPWQSDGPSVWSDGRKELMPTTHFFPFSPRPYIPYGPIASETRHANWTDPWGKDVDIYNYLYNLGAPYENPYLGSLVTIEDFPEPLEEEEGTNSYWPAPGALTPAYHVYKFNEEANKCFKFFFEDGGGSEEVFNCYFGELTAGGPSRPSSLIPSTTKKMGFWAYPTRNVTSGQLLVRIYLEYPPVGHSGFETFTINQNLIANQWNWCYIDFEETPPSQGWFLATDGGSSEWMEDNTNTEISGLYFGRVAFGTVDDPLGGGLDTSIYITGGRLIFGGSEEEAPDGPWGEGGCAGNIDVTRADNATVGQQITSAKLELDSLLKSSTSTNDLLTKITAKWLTDYFNNEPQLITFKNNIAAFGLQEEEIDFFTFNDESQVRNVLEFWGRRKSNYWQTVTFKAFLHGLELLPFDTVAFRLDDIIHIEYNVIGMVTAMTYNPEDFSTEIEVTLAVKPGGRLPSDDFWREHSVIDPSFPE